MESVLNRSKLTEVPIKKGTKIHSKYLKRLIGSQYFCTVKGRIVDLQTKHVKQPQWIVGQHKNSIESKYSHEQIFNYIIHDKKKYYKAIICVHTVDILTWLIHHCVE